MSYKELHELAVQKFSASGNETSLADWIEEHTTLRRRPFSYGRYPFQQRIADDEHPNLSVIKCSQVGLTEIQIRKFFGMLRRENGLSGIFSFPNEAMYKRNYATRMKPILDADTVFNPPSVNKPVRRMDLTQIGDSFGYVTGCGESDATSINADILFHDELDLSPGDMIALFQSRLQGSDKRITQSFSTPTFLGYGIDRNFGLSDQHYYLARCPSCNHWQFPIFNQSFINIPNFKFDVEHLTDLTAEQISDINFKDSFVGCEKCRKPLDLSNPKYREWVPMFPTRTQSRGYKMNPFSTDRLDLPYIFGQLQKYREKENLKSFYNTVLGEPFTESSAQLQKDQIEAVMAPNGSPPNVGHDTAVYMGIDMGQTCHIVLLGDVDSEGKDPFFLFDTCHAMQLSERIADLRKIYNIVQCCVDRYPYTPTVDALRENTQGLIMPIHFGGQAAVQPKLDEADQLIYYIANRTSMLDRVRTVIVNQTAVLSGYGPYRETLVTHLRDMVRDETVIEKEPEWKKLNGNDHFFFAAAYALLARRVCESIFTSQFSKKLMVVGIAGTDIGTSVISNLTNNKSAPRLGLGR
jgi:hypothetical protein